MVTTVQEGHVSRVVSGDMILFELITDDEGRILNKKGTVASVASVNKRDIRADNVYRLWQQHPDKLRWEIEQMADNDESIDLPSVRRAIKKIADMKINRSVVGLLETLLDRTITVEEYNKYAPMRETIEFLIQTGHKIPLLVWIHDKGVQELRVDEAPRPGDILKEVRRDLTKEEWRRLITLPEWCITNRKGNPVRISMVHVVVRITTPLKQMPTREQLDFAMERITRGLPLQLGVMLLEELAREDAIPYTALAAEHYTISDYIQQHNISNEDLARWTYRGLQNRSMRWHQDMYFERARKSGMKAPDIKWTSLVDEWEDEETSWTVTALNSAYELEQEGTLMRHCVGGYASNCAQGNDRIFSVKDTRGERKGTLQLTRTAAKGLEGPYWEVRQLRGERNIDVSQTCKAVSKKFASHYSDVQALRFGFVR